MFCRNCFPVVLLWTIIVTLLLANNAMAYVGPGPGMEFIGYAMSLIAMMGVAVLSILLWPFYTFIRWLRGAKTSTTARPAPTTDGSASSPPFAPSDAGSSPLQSPPSP